MTTNKKGRAGGYQATLKTSECTCNPTRLAARSKGLIATLAVWGLLPVRLADRLTHRGGLRDD